MISYAKVVLLAALWAQGCFSSMAVEPNREAMRETMPLYTVLSNLELLNNTQCREELQSLRDAVDHNILWGMRLLDVSGHPGSGFTIGNNFWPGSRMGCVYIHYKRNIPVSLKLMRNASQYRDPKTEFPPYPVQYYVARFVHNSTQQYHMGVSGQDNMLMGLCLPSSCTVDELAVIIEKIFRDRTLLIGQLYSADFKLVEVSDVIDDYQWLLSGQKILALLWLLLSLGVVIVATLYDVMFYQKRLIQKRDYLTLQNSNTVELKNDVEAKREPEPESVCLDEHKPENMTTKILLCFSANTNAKQIFTFESGANSLPALHGIKFISMLWVIFAHSGAYSYDYMVDLPLMAIYSGGILTKLISNATYSVDTFLCVSGFLMSSNYLKVMRKGKPILTFGMSMLQLILQTIKRFIRLTPAHLIVILIAILNYTYYENTSTYQIYESPSYYCSKYWWRNLLYINNFYSWDELCLSWSWYISNDMQFFIYGTILLLLYTWRSYIGLSLGAVTLISCILWNGYLAYDLDFVLAWGNLHTMFTMLYIQPWLRIGPFLVGMVTAAIIDKMNYKLNLTTKSKILGWTMGVLCNCSILFGGMERNMPILISVIYTAISRTVWGVGISWLIVACITNNGGIVNQILSFKLWIPFSRLTFSAYLLNPLIITSVNLYSFYPHRSNLVAMTNKAVGLWVITYVCSMVLSLVAEAPAINVLKILSNPNRRMK
ncbi:nose resistant to fluoxetine protein 6-like isoform X2 [Lasioglossum baleicum]|uniref:nose resistant to fluoxetine protein 6-like isoform X2 n=1 Tax=Lasioglossum baleicum TaxID=434251 RepID=UPI003FCDA432